MNLKSTTKPIGSAISLALACIFFASAESNFGQTDQAPTTPRPVAPTPPPGGDANADTAGRKPSNGSGVKSGDTRSNRDNGRSIPEEMIVIDAATRQKEKEREKMQRDRTFDGSIMDVGIDSIPRAKPNARPEAIPMASPIPSAGPSAQPSATPAVSSAPSSDLGAGTSLTLEVVPILSASEPSATPSATVSPHN